MMEAAKEELFEGGALRGPMNSLNRFWFFPGQAKYELAGDSVTILRTPVVLLTEEEYLSGSGIAGRGRPEPTAQRFAEDFSARYAAIAREQPIYQELEGLFRLVTLAKLMKYQQVKTDLRYFLDRFPVSKVATPRSVPGVCRVKRFEESRETGVERQTYYLWMPSCGGVSMEVKIRPSDFVKVKTQTSGPSGTASRSRQGVHAALKSRPSPMSLYWDY
jgi:hypothetical protein